MAGTGCRSNCRKWVQITQAEQPRQLGGYILPEKSRGLRHGKRIVNICLHCVFSSAKFHIDLPFTHTKNSSWDNREGGLGCFMGEEKGWILNGAIISVCSTTQMHWLRFQQLCCLLLPIFATDFFLCSSHLYSDQANSLNCQVKTSLVLSPRAFRKTAVNALIVLPRGFLPAFQTAPVTKKFLVSVALSCNT